MKFVQFPGAKAYINQMKIQTMTQKEKIVSKSPVQYSTKLWRHKSGNILKRVSKLKWSDSEYHCKEIEDVGLSGIKMGCNSNQFPALPFCGTYTKPH